jgi:hypothetical protein
MKIADCALQKTDAHTGAVSSLEPSIPGILGPFFDSISISSLQ